MLHNTVEWEAPSRTKFLREKNVSDQDLLDGNFELSIFGKSGPDKVERFMLEKILTGNFLSEYHRTYIYI